MNENLIDFDKKEDELKGTEHFTMPKAAILLQDEIDKLIVNREEKLKIMYLKILKILYSPGGMMNLSEKQFSHIKGLWKQHIRTKALQEVRSVKATKENDEKITVIEKILETTATKAANTKDQIDNEEAGESAA